MRNWLGTAAVALLAGVASIGTYLYLDSEADEDQVFKITHDHAVWRFSTRGPWRVTQEKSGWGGGTFCRGVAKSSDRTWHTIIVKPNDHRGGRWSIEVRDSQLKWPKVHSFSLRAFIVSNPSSFEEAPDVGVGDSNGVNAILQIPKAGTLVSAIRQGKQLKLTGSNGEDFPILELPIDAKIIRELDRCIAHAS